tara:strand:+ start:202 stop:2304 length:2103 start_codon:yes stop_codon:yes gene_type:complete
MVFSNINSNIEYSESLSLDAVDKGREVSLYKIKLFDKNIVIALGDVETKRYDDVFYAPVYLIVTEGEYYKIGIYEFLAKDYFNLLDEENDIDISIIEGPLLFDVVNKEFIVEKMADNDLIEDDEEEELVDEEEDEILEETEMVDFYIMEDDDNDYKMETEKDDKRIRKKYDVNKPEDVLWIEEYYHNDYYDIKDNEGGGDCFFCTIRDAFNSININLSIDKQREMLSDSMSQEQFTTYKELFEDNQKQVLSLADEIKLLQKRRSDILKEYKPTKALFDTEKDRNEKKKLADKLRPMLKEYKAIPADIEKLKKDKKQAQELTKEFMFMEKIKSLDELKELIKTNKYWADSSSITKMELLLNIKVIILNSNNYHIGDYKNVISCGDMVPEIIRSKGIFNPKYYVIMDYTGNHYKLIIYKGNHIYRFHEIPWGILDDLKKKCLSSNSSVLYDYIPKFQKLTGKVVDDSDTQHTIQESEKIDTKSLDGEIDEPEMQPTVRQEDCDYYNENIVFQFYSKSADNARPGKGAGEKIPDENLNEYDDLNKIRNWRKMLSNFYVKKDGEGEVIPLFEVDGYKWASVEHYYHANKFRNEHPEYYKQFTMNSKSEISLDPLKAKGAGGKSGKIKNVKYRPDDVKVDVDFYANKKHEDVMLKGQYMKYKQNEDLKEMLKLTKNAKLVHFIRGGDNIVFCDTMRIRNRLLKNK